MIYVKEKKFMIIQSGLQMFNKDYVDTGLFSSNPTKHLKKYCLV